MNLEISYSRKITLDPGGYPLLRIPIELYRQFNTQYVKIKCEKDHISIYPDLIQTQKKREDAPISD